MLELVKKKNKKCRKTSRLVGAVGSPLRCCRTTVHRTMLLPTNLQVSPHASCHPPPLAAWFKEARTPKHTKVRCGIFLKRSSCSHRREEESLFFNCCEGRQEHFDVLQRLNLETPCLPKFLSSMNCYTSVNCLVCHVCQKIV